MRKFEYCNGSEKTSSSSKDIKVISKFKDWGQIWLKSSYHMQIWGWQPSSNSSTIFREAVHQKPYHAMQCKEIKEKVDNEIHIFT